VATTLVVVTQPLNSDHHNGNDSIDADTLRKVSPFFVNTLRGNHTVLRRQSSHLITSIGQQTKPQQTKPQHVTKQSQSQ
jgi:hypothetical protein